MRYQPGDVCEPSHLIRGGEFVLYQLEPFMTDTLIPKFESKRYIRGDDLIGLTFMIVSVSTHGYQVAASNGATGFVFAHDVKRLDE